MYLEDLSGPQQEGGRAVPRERPSSASCAPRAARQPPTRRLRAPTAGAPHPTISAWILDKKDLQDGSAGGHGPAAVARPSARRLELLLDQCRRDAQHLARLKHPGVLRLVCPLEETRTQLVLLTEPVFASAADLLRGGRLPPQLAAERRSLVLSELELKRGLLQARWLAPPWGAWRTRGWPAGWRTGRLGGPRSRPKRALHCAVQVAEGLHFLHSEAGLVHRCLCPENVYLTHGGEPDTPPLSEGFEVGVPAAWLPGLAWPTSLEMAAAAFRVGRAPMLLPARLQAPRP
jgi:SCY1-like protein 2